MDTFRELYPEKKEFSFFSMKFKSMKDEDKGWRLDYFLIHRKYYSLVLDSIIHKSVNGSDHVPIELKLKIGEGITKKKLVEEEK